MREGIALCRKKRIGLVLAAGGGSAIDSAKAIAMGVPYPGDAGDFPAGKAEPKDALPVGTVLTIPAGSEASMASVITNEDGMLNRSFNSPMIYPRFLS